MLFALQPMDLLLVGVILLAVLLLVCFEARSQAQAAFNARFPPILDAQFLARCRTVCPEVR